MQKFIGKILLVKRISFLTLAMCIATLAIAQEINHNNIKYVVLDSTAKTVRIVDGKSASGNIQIPSTITVDSETYTVKEIGNRAFYNDSNILSVEIPASVDSIGTYAFSECHLVTEFVFNEGLKIIGREAFSSAKEVTSFKIPASVTHIGKNAFTYCPKVNRFVVDSGNTAYMAHNSILYSKDTSELIQFPPANVMAVYTMPNSVKIVRTAAMEGCYKITNIVFSQNLDTIEEAAFLNCVNIRQVDLPEGLKSIGTQAFASCVQLEVVNIPASVTKIEAIPFYVDDQLRAINVNSANTQYSSENGVLFDKNKTTLIVYPRRKSGTDYNLPSTVTTIEYRAFFGNDRLTSIVFPASLAKINSGAFINCSALQQIQCDATNPPQLGTRVFAGTNVSNILLKVPTSAIGAYKAAQVWKDFRFEDSPTDFSTPVANHKYQVYPTYTEGIVFVVADDSCKATVYNAMGQAVKSTALQQGENSIDISEQPAGSYIVRIGENIFKIIKK